MINYVLVQRVKKALFEVDGVEKTEYIKPVRKYPECIIIDFKTQTTIHAGINVHFKYEFIEIEYGGFKNKIEIRIPFCRFEEEKFKETLLKVFELYDEINGINEDKEI